MSLTYSREISCRTLSSLVIWTFDPGARTSGTHYDAPHASLYDTPDPSTRVPETQAPPEARHERTRREIRPKDTYSPSLIRKMFRRYWCIFFLIYDFNFFYLYFYTYFLTKFSYNIIILKSLTAKKFNNFS
jgi:hypothetical protein